jgi:hypothetical protein
VGIQVDPPDEEGEGEGQAKNGRAVAVGCVPQGRVGAHRGRRQQKDIDFC